MNNIPIEVVTLKMDAYTNKMNSLNKLSDERKVLLIFLRQFGCNFCKRTLSDLSKQMNEIESQGLKPVIIYLSDMRTAQAILDIYGLGEVEHISDREKLLYKSFGLQKGNFTQLFGIRVIIHTLKTWFQGFLSGKISGDPYQMPGVFVYHKKKIISRYTYKRISDRIKFNLESNPQMV